MRGITDSKAVAALLTIFAAAVWVAFSFAGPSEAGAASADCPRGPLRADLAGASNGGGKAPGGMAQFRERGTNGLMVMVRGLEAAAGTSLDVMIAGTSVGKITTRNGTGQLKVDSAPEITEGTAVTVMNGETTVLAGQFQCVASGGGGGGGGSTATPSPTLTPTGTATPSPTMMPTVSPTVSPSPTDSPSPSPTPTMAG